MLNILRSYCFFIIHPFRTQEYFAAEAKGQTTYWPYGKAPQMLSIWESISVSWIFAIINAVVSLSLLLFSDQLLETYYQSSKFLESFPQAKFLTRKGAIYWIYFIGGVVLFPFITYISVFIWKAIILFSCRCFGIQGDLNRKADEIIVGYLSAHIVWPIPIFGNLVKKFLSAVALFAGLTRRLKMSGLQAFLTLIMPMMLIVFGSIFFVMLFSILLGVFSV